MSEINLVKLLDEAINNEILNRCAELERRIKELEAQMTTDAEQPADKPTTIEAGEMLERFEQYVNFQYGHETQVGGFTLNTIDILTRCALHDYVDWFLMWVRDENFTLYFDHTTFIYTKDKGASDLVDLVYRKATHSV